MGSKRAEAAEVVDSKGKKVEAMVKEKLGVGNRKFGPDPVVVCSECGFRLVLIGEQTWGRGQRDMRDGDIDGKVGMVSGGRGGGAVREVEADIGGTGHCCFL